MFALGICLIYTPEGIEVCKLHDLTPYFMKSNPSPLLYDPPTHMQPQH